MRRSLLLPFCLLLATPLLAQTDRYELGLRLRASERRLAAAPAGPPRSAALVEFDRAVQAFFRLDLGGVARALDAADRALGADAAPEARFAASLQLVAERRLVDTAAGRAAFTLSRAYQEAADDERGEPGPPDGLTLRVDLVGRDVGWQQPITTLPFAFELPLPALGAGDFTVCWRVCRGDQVLNERTQGLSLSDELDARLGKLATAAEATAETAPASIESRSLPHLWRTLRTMTKKRGEETVLPGDHLLAEAEALAAAVAAGTPLHGPARSGQHWLVVPTTKGNVTLRLLVPEGTTTVEPRPLVLALHGAGGSENLFFDGYGDGAIVPLCAARGWYLAAPRCGSLGGPDLPALIDALAARWPIDSQRVVLVGHSMGAALVVGAASRTPTRFRAVAALGGGGTLARGAELQQLPFFVATGSRDFLAAGARSLRDTLERRGVPTTFRDYPDVEHLTVVQFALPEVFAGFDQALAKR